MDYSDSIEVIVGQEETHFSVHKDTIAERSPFFRAALSHDFREAKEKRVRLPDCEQETFNCYLACIYTLALEYEAGPQENYTHLTKLYILADQLRDVQLCNEIVDHLKRLVDTAPGTEMVRLLYDTFPAGHKMRAFVVALCRDNCDSLWLPDNRAELPPEFVFDLAVEYAECLEELHASATTSPRRHVNKHDRCHWHEHGDEAPACEREAGDTE